VKTVQVSEETWKRLKMRSAETGLTLAVLIDRATAQYLRVVESLKPEGSVVKKNEGAVPVPGDEDPLLVQTPALAGAEQVKAARRGAAGKPQASTRTADPLHGIPEAIGTSEDFPLTSRSEYLGQPRTLSPEMDEAIQQMNDVTAEVLSRPVKPPTAEDLKQPIRSPFILKPGKPKVGSQEWLSMLCGRLRCGHARRIHANDKGRCDRCVGTCHEFLEPEDLF